MNIRLLSRLSAILFAVPWAGAAIYGAQYAAFALEYDHLDELRQGKRPVEAMGFWRRPPDVKPILEPWAAREGMGGAARRRIALDSDTPENVMARFVDVSKALSNEPTSGWLWLEYSSLCLELSFCREKSGPALAMIDMVARREALIKFEEALTLLKNWERLPQDLQAQAIELALATKPRAGREGERRMTETLALKNASVKEAMRSMSLGAEGGGGKPPDWWLKMIK